MRDKNNGHPRNKRTTERAPTAEGAAIRAAFLRHIDEQQDQAGFPAARGSAEAGDKGRRGRDKR